MRSIVFEGDTWERYEELRQRDAALHRVLCRQLKEMQRGDPASGTGKPEPLKHALSGRRKTFQGCGRLSQRRGKPFDGLKNFSAA